MKEHLKGKELIEHEEELSKYKFKSKIPPDEIKKLALEAKSKRVTEKV